MTHTSTAPTVTHRLPRWAPLATGVVTLLAAWGESFFLRSTVYGFFVITALVCSILIQRTPLRSRTSIVVTCVATLGIAAQFAWMVSGWYPAVVTAQAAATVVSFASFRRPTDPRGRSAEGGHSAGRRRALGILGSSAAAGLVGISGIVSIALLAIALAPAGLAIVLQSAAGQTPSFEPRGPEGATTVTNNGDRLTSDISYGNEYPNSFLDVYIADGETPTARPTYIYIHGGGWIAGTKSTGDPNAPDGGFSLIADPILDGGYNLVSLDYGLAPTVAYPTAIVQISQAVSFLQDNAEQLGLDMNEVVIGGGSAGGQLAGQFANIQTNAAYAERIGIDPVIGSALKAVVLDSAALELEKTGETQTPVPLLDFFFGLSARTYLGISDTVIAEASVTDHVTADFPPAFIADGNVGTFPDQASALHERLDELGVANATFLPTREEAELGHGFMGAPSIWTASYNAEKLAFLASLGL